MKRLLLAVGLMCVAGAAQAQMRPSMNPDADGDGKVSFAEFKASQADAMLARLDANKDGKITKDEASSMGGRRGEGFIARIFDRADANNDRVLTRAELEAGAKRRFDAADNNKDGWLSGGELASMRQNRGRGGA